MSRHPLLPDRYTDVSLQASLLFALKPYIITDRSDIVNPQLKWDLQKAWSVAEPLLAKGNWQQIEQGGNFELSADTDQEIDHLNSIIAGMIASEIMYPEHGFSIRRIEHRRGGEMALIISASVAQVLQKSFPSARYSEGKNQ